MEGQNWCGVLPVHPPGYAKMCRGREGAHGVPPPGQLDCLTSLSEKGIMGLVAGFPTSMFTPIFALSRTVGWISQWKEMIGDPQMKIGRPRQLYLGETTRDYVDIENR